MQEGGSYHYFAHCPDPWNFLHFHFCCFRHHSHLCNCLKPFKDAPRNFTLGEAARIRTSGQNSVKKERDSGRYPLKLPFPDPELPTPLPCPVLPLLPPGDPWAALVPKPSASPTGLSTRLYELTEPAVGNVTVSWVHPALFVFCAEPDPESTANTSGTHPGNASALPCLGKMTDRIK